MVRAKVQVYDINDADGSKGPGKTISCSAVIRSADPEDENNKFFNSTPTLSLTMYCVNPEAAAQFEMGKEYYIDFTPAEKAAAE